jgi:hypothetical protein
LDFNSGNEFAQRWLMRAYLNLRFTVPERREMFHEGLRRLGYQVVDGLTRTPERGDILVTWNRIHEGDAAAREFTERGNTVLVTENATWGNEFAGKHWYTLARDYHNVAGMFPVGGPERWDSLGVELEPFRQGGETVVLASRGIGPGTYRMPGQWQFRQLGRLRPHPGRNANAKPLREDLANCGKVVTWGSGAAVLALMWGIRVQSHQPRWIAAQDNTEAGRLGMFRSLAHAQATHEEIRSGEAFARLLTAR